MKLRWLFKNAIGLDLAKYKKIRALMLEYLEQGEAGKQKKERKRRRGENVKDWGDFSPSRGSTRWVSSTGFFFFFFFFFFSF